MKTLSPPMNLPAPSPLAPAWMLDPSVVFLNHGSYGASLREVFDAQTELRARMERDPVRFFKVDLERLFDDVRRALGAFVHAPADCIAPVRNATIAIATIFLNQGFEPGDEVVMTDHEYSSGFNELARMALSQGVRVVRARVPFPISDPGVVADNVISCITPRTRLVVMSHITSATSLVLPVEPVVRECNRRGVDVLVDGAHTPGQTPLDIAALDPTFFVGSLHKWVSAPKGTAFLYVRPDRRKGFRTLCLSSRADKIRPERALFLRDFDYMGTDDYTPLLAIPAALEAMGRLLPGGWPALMEHNRSLALRARRVVAQSAGLDLPCPDSMVGSMASLILPEASADLGPRTTLYDDPLQDALLERHRVQIPVWRLGEKPGVRLIRLSAQVYNAIEQYEHLGRALAQELGAEHARRATA